MKINQPSLFIIFIVILLLNVETTRGKVCYTASVYADWDFNFTCNGKPFNVTDIYVDICYSHFWKTYVPIQHIKTPTSVGHYNLSFYQHVHGGIVFWLYARIYHLCHPTENESTTWPYHCTFWPRVDTYSCSSPYLIPFVMHIDLSKSGRYGSECHVIYKHKH
uniref:S-protein homolog n=1 Tax=Parastrongyloides trichosuri TaxID=131310 RepID=A0A0N4Z7R7_PARTI